MIPAIHETAIHAMEHGNGMDPDMMVSIRCVLCDQYALTEVEDEDDGFNWRDYEESGIQLDLDKERGRGIAIMYLACDQVKSAG